MLGTQSLFLILKALDWASLVTGLICTLFYDKIREQSSITHHEIPFSIIFFARLNDGKALFLVVRQGYCMVVGRGGRALVARICFCKL